MKVSKNPSPEAEVQAANNSAKYAEATKYIRAAVDCLGKMAKDDILAKESIANLGVVLLDLNK